MEREILTVKEAAEYLRMAPRAVYKLAQAGKIPAKKLASKWLFSRAALARMVGGE